MSTLSQARRTAHTPDVPEDAGGPSGTARVFTEMLADGGVSSLYQPIVSLDSGRPVAFEALARGPQGGWHRPDQLFGAARDLGLLAELDQACRVSALEGAVRLGVTTGSTLFINIEPQVIDADPLAALASLMPRDAEAGRVVLEVTERALTRRPAELLRTVALVRSFGWGIALDDVGVEPASLAFLSLLEPDVVKLDMGLVQDGSSGLAAQVMHCVNAYAERSGAQVLAEGIETQRHLDNARALGASLGQGWLFGRPSAHPEVVDADVTFTRHRTIALPTDRVPPSPFQALSAATPLRRAPKRLLIELSKNLEQEAARIGETAVVAATFQHARHFTPRTRDRYADLAHRVGFVCVLGEDFSTAPLTGVRGADLPGHDPVRDEWDLVVLSPHFAVALLARDIGTAGPEMDREFEFALTYDRTTTVRAAQALFERVSAAETGPQPSTR